MTVAKDFLVRVDSYCSLVAYREMGTGTLDGETRQQLIRLSHEARAGYEAPPDTTPPVTVVSSYSIALRCEECDQQFVLYDPNAERGHEIAVVDLVADAQRHARECGG